LDFDTEEMHPPKKEIFNNNFECSICTERVLGVCRSNRRIQAQSFESVSSSSDGEGNSEHDYYHNASPNKRHQTEMIELEMISEWGFFTYIESSHEEKIEELEIHTPFDGVSRMVEIPEPEKELRRLYPSSWASPLFGKKAFLCHVFALECICSYI
jgi:hypothetical protein